MKRLLLLTIILSVVPIGPAAGQEVSGNIDFSERERARILQHSPLPPVPNDKSNRFASDPSAAALGQFLFFDTRLSSDSKTSCATCHNPARSFTDGRPIAIGRGTGSRNTPALWNVAYQRWFFWDGRADTLWAQILGPLEGAHELGSNRMRLARLLRGDATLREAYRKVFGPLPDLSDEARFPLDACPTDNADDPQCRAWTAMKPDDRAAIETIVANVGKALAAYQSRLVSRRSPFDLFVESLRENNRTGQSSLTPTAQRGLKLFIGRANCRLCHSGPTFSDNEFHDIRVPPRNPDAPADPGRFFGIQRLRKDPFNSVGAHSDDRSPGVTGKLTHLAARASETWGAFKTPTLRNVARTAPYMHEGQFESLADVLNYYSTLKNAVPRSHHGNETILVPLNLSAEEIAELVAFLEALTDESVDPALLRPPATPLHISPSSSPAQP